MTGEPAPNPTSDRILPRLGQEPDVDAERIVVLLVDDQPTVGAAVHLMLAGEPGIEFHFCREAEQAVSRAREVGATVVLQDLVMPDADGLDIVQRFRSTPGLSDLPLVVLSGRDEPDIKAEAFRRGANDYLVKLPDPVELIARVRYHSRSYNAVSERNRAMVQLREFGQLLQLEQLKSEELLLNILPAAIAEQLKESDDVIAEAFGEATVLFADIVDFSGLAHAAQPSELLGLLNQVFSRFDALADQNGLEKIKTIGDAYMAVAGVPERRSDHAARVADMALDMIAASAELPRLTGRPLELRIGICSGPVVAGVIGKSKFAYDLWGTTVNRASRMESHGVPGRIQLDEVTKRCLERDFLLEPRGEQAVKGEGTLPTWFLIGRRGR